MTIILFGGGGQLGRALEAADDIRHYSIAVVPRTEADITVFEDVERIFFRQKPALVINAAAYTQVDRAEDDAETAFAVNQTGPDILARACRNYGVPLIHISTDFVFDGCKSSPYTESDSVNPLGVYGKSKAAGEAAVRSRLAEHIIVRTSWLYGCYGNNFVKTVLRLGCEKKHLDIVNDQIGCPTSSHDFAAVLIRMAEKIRKGRTDIWGTYHYCGKGAVSWYAFAKAIIGAASEFSDFPEVAVHPVTTDQYPARAKRPRYSVLNCDKILNAFGIRIKHWKESLLPVVRTILSHPERFSAPIQK
ncbi:MAG: dTDP-4-dehydrorhamnose reductase [Desulfobacterales bacterium]